MAATGDGAARILVVEDEPAIVTLLQSYLGEHGYQVAAATSAEEALAHIDDRAADIIVLDLGLPGMSGLDLCRRLRAQGDVTPIVVVSAQDREGDKVRALNAGADDYVTKPFGMRELLARIRVAIRHAGREPSRSPAS